MTRIPELPLLEEALLAMPSPSGQAQVTGLESGLAAEFGTRHVVTVSSGTAAIQAALIGCGAGPGTEVLVPALTVVMTVAAIVATGARPVFVETSADGFGLDLADAEAKLTSRTIAILPVHIAGRIGDLGAVRSFADRIGLKLVEDACQAQGSWFRGSLAGTIGDAGCFSMKDGKILSCGEGGYILTNDPDIAGRAAAFRTHWQTGIPEHPPGSRLGHNFRLAEPLAALARHNLTSYGAAVRRRREQTTLLAGLSGDVPGLEVIPAGPGEEPNGFSAIWRITAPRPRALCERLATAGVINSVGAFGLKAAHANPACRELNPAVCPRAERMADTLLSVPLTSADDDSRITRIAQLIRKEVSAWR